MQNDLKYTIRSREIVDLYSAMRNQSLTLSPYFQRNLVWRDAHKRDFIETILQGYPFPQIFLARGPIDLDTMSASQAVVDGQQRLNTIREFINGSIDAYGKNFVDLSPKEKEDFLKYEVAVIDFDLDANDPRLKDIFHRLNRTFYSLSAIEKLASEYSASEFMLLARVLSGEILKEAPEGEEFTDIATEDADHDVLVANVFSRDPGIDENTWAWMIEHAEGPYQTLLREQGIFSTFEFDRKVPLMFTLNVMCSYLTGYYERNDRVRKFLDEKSNDFPEKSEVYAAINESANYIGSLELPKNSMWWNKANFFTILCEFARLPGWRLKPTEEVKNKLIEFSQNVPPDYSLAAREAVGRKPQRELRAEKIRALLDG